MVWVKNNCKERPDLNPEKIQRSREQKDADWATVVKMTLIARDLMIRNLRLAELGRGEEALGRNSLVAGFQGRPVCAGSYLKNPPNGVIVGGRNLTDESSFGRLERVPSG